MRTQRTSAPPSFEGTATETAPDLDADALALLRAAALPHDVGHSPFVRQPRPEPGMRRLWSNLGRWVFAATAATTPMFYVDVRQELRRSGASAIIWTGRRRRGHRISLAEARELAFRILAETERRLHEEREAEARFILSFWEDGDVAGE